MNEQDIKLLLERNEQLVEQNNRLVAKMEQQQQQIEELLSKKEEDKGTVLGNALSKHIANEGQGTILDKVTSNKKNEGSDVHHFNTLEIGYGNKELLDRERIMNVENEETRIIPTSQREPLILFVGPASCGKSMVLMSLVEYLAALQEYSVEPNLMYLPYNREYAQKCATFNQMLVANTNRQYKLPLPKTMNEILLEIRENGTRKYTMLEAPGEDFFDIGDSKRPYKEYIKDIITTAKGPIYYVMLLDLHTPNNNFANTNDPVRKEYEKRLIEIIRDGYKNKRGDKIIFLYNKYDLHDPGLQGEKAIMNSLFKDYYKKIKSTKELYPSCVGTPVSIAPRFKELPYMSGIYSHKPNRETGEKVMTYQTTPDVTALVKRLWDTLKY